MFTSAIYFTVVFLFLSVIMVTRFSTTSFFLNSRNVPFLALFLLVTENILII